MVGFAACNEKKLEDCPETFYIFGSLAMLFKASGKHDEAVSALEKQVQLLNDFTQVNPEYRHSMGDALATMAMITTEMLFVGLDTFTEEEIDKSLDQAFAGLDRAKSHFEQMQKDEILNERSKANLERMIKTRELLETARDNGGFQ